MNENKQTFPSDRLANAARALAVKMGLTQAAALVGVSPMTLATIAARLPGHRSTHRLAAGRLEVL